ncbi:MAG: MucR family transcriptional regulator [Syntrophobacteraceae bacterium]
MPKKLIEIASEIVQTQVASSPMTATDIASSLRQVFGTLCEMQKAEAGGIELAPTAAEELATTKLTPQDSIQKDKVICLECGAEMKQLTSKHLVSHGMSQKEYRKKYGFTMRTPLSAKSLTKARSKAAKKRGLPEKLQKYMEARRQDKAQAPIQAATEIVPAGKQKPILTPENSIQDDKVICLECGLGMRQLTVKHLVSHGMDLKQYKEKYGFSMKTPLMAKSVTEAMSNAAKKRGLPEKLTQLNEARKKEKTEGAAQTASETVTASKPKRTRLRKKKVA